MLWQQLQTSWFQSPKGKLNYEQKHNQHLPAFRDVPRRRSLRGCFWSRASGRTALPVRPAKLSERSQRRKGGFYRCNACKLDFTIRTGTIFERSHVPLHKWLYAMYLLVTARKGICSMQLAKEIGITQKSAWFMLHRLREACGGEPGQTARHYRNGRMLHRRQGSATSTSTKSSRLDAARLARLP